MNFKTPCGKYCCLPLPFGLILAGDVFQERLDRVLKSVPSTTGIADDVLCHGNAEIPHDAVVITLLETARANNLTFKAEKFVFKSQLLLKPETTSNTEISVPHCAFLMMHCDFLG